MRYHVIFLLLCFTVPLVLTSGCGQQKTPAQQTQQQSSNQSDRPIDTQLQQQMKMYQEIKKDEYDQYEKRRTAEKKRLKELQKTREEALRRELESQEKLKANSNPWSSKQTDKNKRQHTDQKKGQGA